MLCRLDSLSETAYNLYNHVRKYIHFYSSVLDHFNENVTKKIFTDYFTERLEGVIYIDDRTKQSITGSDKPGNGIVIDTS